MRGFKNILFILLIVSAFTSCEEALDLLSDDPRDAFVGDWSVKEENTLKSVDYYNVSIEKSANDSSVVFIKNFYAINYSVSVSAVVTGSNIRVPVQTVSGFTIQGYGNMPLKGNTIGWSYTVDHNNGFIDQVTATYTRQ